ncbi:MAG: septal ring lytic transglycosylase RlpA family protein [Aquifex sp.]|nr:MAG: septal ring lytic transglycosylase RlpA family protein [Aquifex sp.]
MKILLILVVITLSFSRTFIWHETLRDYHEFKLYIKEEEVYKEFIKHIKVKKNCKIERGIASWYGPKFHGRKTANGEIFNLFKLTAASRTLPLGTYVLVYNLENGKFVVVRINDRGPYIDGRIIDLSFAAAFEIGLYRKGIGEVLVIPLKCLSPSTQLRFYDELVKDILKTY